MTYNICNCNTEFKNRLYWLRAYMIILISSINYIYSITTLECSMIYIWFNFMRYSIIIFIKINNLLKNLIINISTNVNIHSILKIKFTTNPTITFSNIHYINCTCIMSLFINIIIFKTSYYILWYFHTFLYTTIKSEVSSIVHILIKCLSK